MHQQHELDPRHAPVSRHPRSRRLHNRHHVRAPRISFLLFVLIIALLPFPLGSNRPWAWAAFEAGVFLLAAGWLLLFIFNKQQMPTLIRKVRLPLYLLFAWLAYQLVQTMPLPKVALEILSPGTASLYAQGEPVISTVSHSIAIDPDAVHEELLKNSAYVVTLFLTLVLVDSRRRLKVLAIILLSVGMLEALYGTVVYFAGDAFSLWHPSTDGNPVANGTFPNRNHYGAHLVMAIAVTLGLLVAGMKPNYTSAGWRAMLRRWISILLEPKVLLVVALFFLFAALYLSKSRGANLSLFIALASTVSLGVIWHGRSSRVAALLPVLLALAIGAAIILGSGELLGRMLTMQVEGNERVLVWINSLQMVKDYPLFGVGEGGYGWLFPAYKDASIAESYYNHAHNDHLELLVDQGIIGVLLIGSALFLLLRSLLKAYKERQDPLMRGMLFASLTAVIAIIVHGFFDFNFRIPANAAWFFLLLGIGLVASRLPAEHN